MSIVKLPVRMVSPNAPPPPEAFDELRDAKILDRVDKKAFLFTDGAHSWPKLVKWHNLKNKARLTVHEVKHYTGQYTSVLKQKVARGQSSIAGTQSLDQRWRWMKAYIPTSLKGRVNRDANPKLDSYVFSYQFRVNTRARGKTIWSALGQLVKQRKQ
jgi:hypothetical protein